MDDEILDEIPDEETKAVFLSDMTEQEFQEYQRKEIRGWKKFDQYIHNLTHGKRSN